MKQVILNANHRFYLLLFIFILLLLIVKEDTISAQGTAISTDVTNPTPDGNAVLDLQSTTKGFLAPRIATDPSSTAGLLYYNTTSNLFKFYNGSGWLSLAPTVSPSFTTPILGTPQSGTLTNCTGLPLTTGITGTLSPANGGTGVANNAASTITISGNYATTFTLTNNTNITLPSSGTLATTTTLVNVRVFTSGTAATYTPTAGTNAILVKLVGGGGGGGGSANCSNNANAGGGGGAGGYCEQYYTTGGKTFTYTVGIAGVGGVGGNPGNSVTASTASTFTDGITLITGGAGGGGVSMTSGTFAASAAGGTGGTATGAQINSPGSSGGNAFRSLTTSFYLVSSGNGGSSLLGTGGSGVTLGTLTNTAAGRAGNNYGAGGSGSANVQTTATGVGQNNGGNGSPGVIIIYEYK